jgi:hypothetical protein
VQWSQTPFAAPSRKKIRQEQASSYRLPPIERLVVSVVKRIDELLDVAGQADLPPPVPNTSQR